MKVEILSPPRMPYGTIGASAGNIVAYEIAEQFKAMGLLGGNPDCRLTIWDSDALIKFGMELPTVVYQGDYDGEPALCRLRDQPLFQEVPSLLRRSVRLAGIWRDQRRIANKLKHARAICHTADSNVDRYSYPRSIYVGNTWTNLGGLGRQFKNGVRAKIIGHIGKLSATGSTYGLQFLRKSLSYIEHEMGSTPYTIHIIGDGALAPGLRDLAFMPRVIMQGYVADLDAEIANADVVCVLNNAGPYLAAYSRHLLAWSSGACLAVHSRSRLAVPEMNYDNAAMGSTPQSMAWAIAEACRNTAYNRRIREAGYATYFQSFRPSIIATKLASELETI